MITGKTGREHVDADLEYDIEQSMLNGTRTDSSIESPRVKNENIKKITAHIEKEITQLSPVCLNYIKTLCAHASGTKIKCEAGLEFAMAQWTHCVLQMLQYDTKKQRRVAKARVSTMATVALLDVATSEKLG